MRARLRRKLGGRNRRFRNREGLREYDFVLPRRGKGAGVSVMLRARNEENKIITCLSSILPLFDEIVFVDNGSVDSTLELVRRFKRDHDRNEVIVIHEYPHDVATYGERHQATPKDSVHSPVYFYNWCRAKCTRRYVCKWDADMALANGATDAFHAFLVSIAEGPQTLGSFPLQTLYRAAGIWYLAKGDVNEEARVFPNRSAMRFEKALHWEALRTSGVELPTRSLGQMLAYELKDTAEDEFSHWTTTDFPTPRKKLEWRNFNLVKNGELSPELFEPLDGEIFATVEDLGTR
jgi:hypothetical protein